MNLFAGYSWNNKNLMLWEIIGIFDNTRRNNEDMGLIGLNGINWYHYFDSTPQSWYTVLGFGQLVSYPIIDEIAFRTTGLGIVIGGGYEISKQIQISLCYVGGKSSSTFRDVTNNMLYASVSVVAY